MVRVGPCPARGWAAPASLLWGKRCLLFASGLIEIFRAIPTGEVVTNGQPHTTSTYERFLDAIASGKIKYREVKRGDTISLGSLTFQVLHPASTAGDLNSCSLVLRLAYVQVSFLFTADGRSAARFLSHTQLNALCKRGEYT